MRTKAIVSLLVLFGLLFVLSGESYAKAESKDKDIHITEKYDPETGIRTIGIGKGGKGKPPKTKDGGGATVDGCKMGTGYNSDWFITGETYTFESGNSVCSGIEFSFLYTGKTVGVGWYRPNGSTYWENMNDTTIPNPADSGYEYWSWYNVISSYEPMPSSMSSDPGNWTMRWYDSGSNVCSKSYTVCTAPPAPTGVSASDETICGQVSITWSSSGSFQYRVFRDGIGIGSWQSGTSYTDSPGDCSTHTYYVKARNTCGSYPESSPSSSNPGTAKCPPSTPTGVTASDGTVCNQVSITWSPASGADSYIVYRDGVQIYTTASTNYTDTPGDCSPHNYQVVAQNSCGPSGMSSSDSGNAMCAPSPPTGVSATDGTICDQVSITWNSASGADDYVVYRDSVQIYTTASTSYTDTPGDCSAHNYQVEAQNSCGPSGLSSGDPGKTMCTPIITIDPVQVPDPVCDGNDVTFTVVTTGDALHYQWKVDNVNVGFDNPSYLWTGVSLSDDGAQVVCEVWNDCDTVASNPATLDVSIVAPPHQSDSDSDWRIVISEVTAYGSCWKTGCTWPVEPNPIPIGYVTNCGFLWKTGECYSYNDLEVEPQCWQATVCGGGSMLMMGGGAALGPVSSSFNPLNYTAESPVVVTVEITPDPGTMVYAVEDAPPVGWTVDTINESGSWDDVNKKVKWGPFFDANIRTLTYNATPPAAETGEKTFSGTASFDGSDEPIVRPISDICPLDGVGNLDDDCDVDLFDFAIFASHWLEGV